MVIIVKIYKETFETMFLLNLWEKGIGDSSLLTLTFLPLDLFD